MPLADWSQGVAFLRTDDAGEHWTSIANQVSDCCGPDFFFADLNDGVLLYNNGKTYLTANGAKTWHALLAGSAGLRGWRAPVRFTDPEVGWILGESPDNSYTDHIAYSTDGGQHWKMSQNVKFPIGPRYGQLKCAFPGTDRAYVIGTHGMIYRYRVVPVDYSAKSALAGPLVSAPPPRLRHSVELSSIYGEPLQAEMPFTRRRVC